VYKRQGDICARVKYKAEPIEVAARAVIDELKAVGGTGGVIALDAEGNMAMPYSTATMARGHVGPGRPAEIIIEIGP